MDTFSFQYCGDCLGDLVPSGTMLTAMTAEKIAPMDMVAVVLKADAAGPFAAFMNGIGAGGYAGVTKIYLGSHRTAKGETVYRLGQLNPPLVTPIPARVVESMGKVVEGDFDRASAADMEALELLSPFVLEDAFQ